MRSSALAAALLLSLAAPAAADPVRLYGAEMRYDILRNGDPVGRHLVRFEPRPDGLAVQARSEIRVSFLGFTAYRFDYQSDSLWRDGRLMALRAVTDDDGAVTVVEARADGRHLQVQAPEPLRHPAPLFPTDHWDARVLSEREVLNTLTGRVNLVSIRPATEESLRTAAGAVPARRFDYSGELELSSWYDAEGRWLGMRFAGRDGSRIDYVCRVCGLSGELAGLP